MEMLNWQVNYTRNLWNHAITIYPKKSKSVLIQVYIYRGNVRKYYWSVSYFEH